MTLRRSPLKRRKPEKMGVRVRPQVRSESFKQFVRGFPCLVAGVNGHVCDGKIQFAHVRMGNDGGMGLKPSDCHGVPMCDRAHIRIVHQHGEPAFEREFVLKLNDEADRYWAEWLREAEAGRRFKRQQQEG